MFQQKLPVTSDKSRLQLGRTTARSASWQAARTLAFASLAFLYVCQVFGQGDPEGLLPEGAGPAEIEAYGGFLEPLKALGESESVDNAAVVTALRTWHQRSVSDDYAALESFLAAHPSSVWAPSIRLNLGILYYRTGYFSKAIAAYAAAWETARGAPSEFAEAVANRAVAELAEMYARVGRKADLTSILDEAKGRDFQGHAKVQIDRAREGLTAMNHKPEVSFRCGPYSLTNVAAKRGLSVPPAFLEQVASTDQGFNMVEVRQMASEQLQMPMTVVRRPAGGSVPVPSVIHLKCGHFGALMESASGHYNLKDPTFGNDTWMSMAAVDDESSGLFLVPADAVPADAIEVTDAEASQAYGKGHSGNSDPDDTKECSKQSNPECACDGGMAGYSFHLMRASLVVKDKPIWLVSPVGPPVALEAAYHQREYNQPATMTFTHFGQQWVSNWVSYLEENSTVPAADVTIRHRGGGGEQHSGYVATDATSGQYARHRLTGDQLVRTAAGVFELQSSDGSKLVYSRTDATTGLRKVFLSKVVDAWGNEVLINYDAIYKFRISSITNAVGKSLYFFYTLAGDNYAVTQVADHATPASAVKKATFAYETVGSYKRLLSITDPVGIVSSFLYDSSGFMTSMTTPYGTTRFEAGNPSQSYGLARWVQATDAQGAIERVEYRMDTNPVMTEQPVVEGLLTTTNDWDDRNAYYWSKSAWAIGPGDPTKAHVYHWLQVDNADYASGILEWEKPALRDRIWYTYPGQTSAYNIGTAPMPAIVATTTEAADGTLQSVSTKSSYHPVSGGLTEHVNDRGIKTRYTYDASGVDVIKTEFYSPVSNEWRTGDEITAYYSVSGISKHAPQQEVDAQGVVIDYAYNAKGQPTLVTRTSDIAGVVQVFKTKYTYDTNGQGVPDNVPGFLMKVEETHPDIPAQFVTTSQFTYDNQGRVRTKTDLNGYTLTYDYDALDRLTKTTHPDASFEQSFYVQDGRSLIQPTAVKGRDGRQVRYRYNALGQRTMMIDAGQQASLLQWCLCGDLKSMTDADGRTTKWNHDIEGRVTSKLYPSGEKVSYTYYPNSGLLHQVTMPADQGSGHPTYSLTYDGKGNLVGKDYFDSQTPDVTYAYQDSFGRVTSMTDGLGTTSYQYRPLDQNPGAGRLEVIDGPWADDAIRYKFSHMGGLKRVENVSEPVGPGSVVKQFAEWTEDNTGRIKSEVTDLGTFSSTYNTNNPTHNPDTETYSIDGAQVVTTAYAYYPSTNLSHQRRLQQMVSSVVGSGAQISRHEYGYGADGHLKTWRYSSASFQQAPVIDRLWEMTHDSADQIRHVVSKNPTTMAEVERWDYGYDRLGNRLYDSHNAQGAIHSVNSNSQVVKRGGAGSAHVSGTVDKASTVLVNNQPAKVMAVEGGTKWLFESNIPVVVGDNPIQVKATDGVPQTRTKSYSVTVSSASSTFEYDDNGNMSSELDSSGGVLRSYEWNAENQLVGIVYPDGSRTEMSYDGDGKRRVIVEKTPTGTQVSEKRFLWQGGVLWQERDAIDRVTARFHGWGHEVLSYTGNGTTPASVDRYLVLTDHLGSHRETLNVSGGIVGRRDYDPFGTVTQSSGTLTPFGFTGHYTHHLSGLSLTWHRAYDSRLGKWLSRDPSEESGGLNLYAMAGNSPLENVDQSGLAATIVPGVTVRRWAAAGGHQWLNFGPGVNRGVIKTGGGDGWVDENARGSDNDNPSLYYEWNVKKRSSGKMPDGTSCKCATVSAIRGCIGDSVLYEQSHGLPQRFNILTNNCRKNSERILSKCCASKGSLINNPDGRGGMRRFLRDLIFAPPRYICGGG